MKDIEIYTDGACSGNPGMGGYAAVLLFNGNEKSISGFEQETTNNRMELMAAIKALLLLKEKCNVKLYSDSAYLCNAFNQHWIDNWIKNNFKSSTKEAVKNVDLWIQLIEQNKNHNIQFVKVKGHADNEYNNKCDKLATDEIKLRKQTEGKA